MEKVVTQCGYDRIVIYGNNLQFTTKCYIPRDAMLSAVYTLKILQAPQCLKSPGVICIMYFREVNSSSGLTSKVTCVYIYLIYRCAVIHVTFGEHSPSFLC